MPGDILELRLIDCRLRLFFANLEIFPGPLPLARAERDESLFSLRPGIPDYFHPHNQAIFRREPADGSHLAIGASSFPPDHKGLDLLIADGDSLEFQDFVYGGELVIVAAGAVAPASPIWSGY